MPVFKSLRLKSEAIVQVFQKGRAAAVSGITLRYRFRAGGGSRFAFVVSGKVSPKSTVRNKVRRRASEWVRKNAVSFAPGFDVVFIFQKEACSFSPHDVTRAMVAIVRKTPLVLLQHDDRTYD